MRFLRELVHGTTAYGKAIAFIRQHSLWRYVLVPAIINLLIFLGALVWQFSTALSNWITGGSGSGYALGVNIGNPFWDNFLEWAIFIIIKLLTFLLYVKFYRYTILLLSAPALALLAERTQEILTGITHPFHWRQLLSDVWRGTKLTLRHLIVELALTLPLYVLSLFPVFTPFTAPLILLIGSYFVGFSMMDYRNEYRRLSAPASRRLIRQHRGLAIGNGLLFNLLLIIPFLGVLMAPPLGVIAAALAAERVLNADAPAPTPHPKTT